MKTGTVRDYFNRAVMPHHTIPYKVWKGGDVEMNENFIICYLLLIFFILVVTKK